MQTFSYAMAGLTGAFGLVLAIAGALLAGHGGSWQFLLVGAATLCSAWLQLRRRSSGYWLYGAAWLLETVWSLREVGARPIELFPRLWPAILLGLCLVPAALATRSRPTSPQ